MNEYICVVGGANIDITGRSYTDLNPADSNPGKTKLSLGGVGRNIAENLSRLGVKVEMITVLGNDSYAREIVESCQALGISLDHTLVLPEERTSSYLSINDPQGEMALAISDMEIYDKISPHYLEKKLDFINKSKALILDTNISKESLKFLMEKSQVPIFLDTVSTKKTEKIKDLLGYIYALKPNMLEAEILSGIKINNEEDLEKAASIILDKGLKMVFISMGPKGVYYANKDSRGHLFPPPTEVRNVTGAGDTFMAAVAWAYLMGFDIEKSTKVGMAASSICISSNSTISEDISVYNINKIIKENWRS